MTIHVGRATNLQTGAQPGGKREVSLAIDRAGNVTINIEEGGETTGSIVLTDAEAGDLGARLQRYCGKPDGGR